ncbi:MAG: hypothetical protein ABH952_06910 [Candidatus Omnitrophota bacterium]
MDKIDNYNKLKTKALAWGADVFGVAELSGQRIEFSPEIERLKDKYCSAISVGMGLASDVVETIVDHPTLIYSWHYRQLNSALDQIALRIVHYIKECNYSTLPIAASQLVDWKRQKAHLSHKHVADLAGIGWWGRNNLIVSPKFGSRLRFVTILTNLPLKRDNPLNRDCGQCRRCINVCPAGAIREKREDFEHEKCYQTLRNFSKLAGVKYHICGICIRACSALSN